MKPRPSVGAPPADPAQRRKSPRVDALSGRIFSASVRDGRGKEWSGFVSNLSESGAGLMLLGLPPGQVFTQLTITGRIVGAGLSIRFDGRTVWQREDRKGTVSRMSIGVQFVAAPEGLGVLLSSLTPDPPA